MGYPRMLRIRQHFDSPRLDDVAGTVEHELAKLKLAERIRPGQSVAITAGSRGIANIAEITRAICDHVHALDAQPFIVPAMGSHGGGTAEGQQAILAGYGITSESMGAEIRSSMETVVVGETPQGIPVHFDRHAWEADHVIVAGRIKPHTGFVGEIESGLHKMMLIGLGKHAGATVYHRAILDYSFPEIIEAVGASVLEKCSIAAGLAIVENARDETGMIEAVAPGDFYEREKELLLQARRWMPRLPFPKVDLLIVDEIGKNISGSGMDTNVIGRKYNDHAATEKDDVACRRVFVRGLTTETHGNACGLGMAEFTNERTIRSVDIGITRINALTGGHPTAAMLPMSWESDREVLDQALGTVGYFPPEQARVVQICNTLRVEEVLVSEAYADEVARRSDLEQLSDPAPMSFDNDGNLLPVFEAATAAGH